MVRQSPGKLFANWHPLRWVALVLGGVFAAQAIYFGDWPSGLIGAFFLFQAVNSSGCLGSARCRLPDRRSTVSDRQPVEIDEPNR